MILKAEFTQLLKSKHNSSGKKISKFPEFNLFCQYELAPCSSSDCTDGNGRDSVREMENLRRLVGYSDFRIDWKQVIRIWFCTFIIHYNKLPRFHYSDDVLWVILVWVWRDGLVYECFSSCISMKGESLKSARGRIVNMSQTHSREPIDSDVHHIQSTRLLYC